MTKRFTQAIVDLKETYPDVIKICNNWQLVYQNHGIPQSKEEIKLMKKFSHAMKIITQQKNTNVVKSN